MSRIGTVMKNRRDSARTSRNVSRVIERVGSPSVRNELVAIAEAQSSQLR